MDTNLYQDDGPGYEPTAPRNTNRDGGRSDGGGSDGGHSDGGHRGGRGRVIAGVAAAAVLAGGAAFGAVTILNSGPATAAAGPTGQAAVLNSALTSAATPATTASGAAAAARHLRRPLARLRLLGGLDGQFTFEAKSGPRTLAFERGTVESVASGDVVVRAADGTTWSWDLVSTTVVRDSGKKTTASALSAGQLVFVGGPVVNGSHDARLIVIRNPGKTRGPSASTGTSTSVS